MNLDINVSEIGSEKKLILSGEIDAYTAPSLKEQLIPLTKETGAVVLVDLENVTYMDSTGLGVFVGALKSTKENDSKMKLINLQERVYRLFKITGLNDIMDIDSIVRGGM